jgi:hypothetical protein
VVGYIGDSLWFSLRVTGPPSAWSAQSNLGALTVEYGDDHATVNVHLQIPADGPHVAWIEFSGPVAHRHVRLLEPGHGGQIRLDSWQHLSAEGDSVVLVVDRTEPNRDRRWRPVRLYEANQPIACNLTLPAPVVSDGASGVLADIVASQAQEVEDRNVMVMVPSSDQSAGWKHREYRQVLAWLVSDLLQRRAGHVVLAEPLAPRSLAAQLKPIIAEVHDVADAYHCRILTMAGLGDDQYWQISPGILGTTLNAGGRAALDVVLAPWH